jgi:hypothetical protein
MAGQMAKKCEEVAAKRGMAPVKANDKAVRSHLPVAKRPSLFSPATASRKETGLGLKVQALPSPLLLISDENSSDHFNSFNGS